MNISWQEARKADPKRNALLQIPIFRDLYARITNRHITQKELLIMTSQLATMLASGCDLCAGLEAMAKQQPKPYLKQVVTELHDNVKAGQAFSQALGKHPDVFKPIFVTMVRAGESAGLLKSMLSTLQGMIRNQLRITTSIRSALMYPCILIGVAVTAIIVMTTFVLPRFAMVFKSSGVPLPTSTRIVIGTAEFVGAHPIPIFAGGAALATGILYLLTLQSVKPTLHSVLLKIPLLGAALRLSYVVRSIQTLGMLVRSGLPLAEALVLTRDMMPNMYFYQFFDSLRTHIGEGKSLTPDFEKSTLFPPMVAQMMSVGEQTGTLANVCLEVAAFFEEEMAEKIKVLTTAIEPMIIVGLGGFVGFIAISVILPMFKISSALK
jgi:type IV pilus assembly protein PilC